MAYDCIVIDFNNKCRDENLRTILQKFPYAIIVPFVSGYHDIIKSLIGGSRTTNTWMLSTKINYSDFDFDYIPEQHESTQLHVWNNPGQKEGRCRGASVPDTRGPNRGVSLAELGGGVASCSARSCQSNAGRRSAVGVQAGATRGPQHHRAVQASSARLAVEP